MIYEKVGNLLSSTEINVALHQANLFHTFGAGIARVIKDEFPEAYEADLKTPHGDASKLGTISIGKIRDNKGSSIEFIANMYSQTGLGGQDRQTSYDSMVVAMLNLKDRLTHRMSLGKPTVLGIPYQLGCGLANGNWLIVRAIIESIFSDAPFDVIIYKLPEVARMEAQKLSGI